MISENVDHNEVVNWGDWELSSQYPLGEELSIEIEADIHSNTQITPTDTVTMKPPIHNNADRIFSIDSYVSPPSLTYEEPPVPDGNVSRHR